MQSAHLSPLGASLTISRCLPELCSTSSPPRLAFLKFTFLAYFFCSFGSQHFFPSISHTQNHNVPPSVVQELIHFIMRFASHFLSHKEMHPSQRQGIHFDLTERMRCDTLLPRSELAALARLSLQLT